MSGPISENWDEPEPTEPGNPWDPETHPTEHKLWASLMRHVPFLDLLRPDEDVSSPSGS